MGISAPAVAVFSRCASASYGEKNGLGTISTAAGSIGSVFCPGCALVVNSVFADEPSTTVRIECGCPRTVASMVMSRGRQSGV
jgi:hypothetical protein